jgi:hypothetical protein
LCLAARSRAGWPSVGFILLFGVLSFVFKLARFQPFFWDVSPSALTAEAEQALKPRDEFRECMDIRTKGRVERGIEPPVLSYILQRPLHS